MKTLTLLTGSTLALLATSCGLSPLFNHEQAHRQTTINHDGFNKTQGENENNTPTVACSLAFPTSGLCASLTWDGVGPSGDEENSFTLRFQDSNGVAHDAPADVAVQIWMPSMGHGSSPVIVTAKGGGVYQATRVFFIMPGAWDIRIQLKINGQLSEQAVLSVTI